MLQYKYTIHQNQALPPPKSKLLVKNELCCKNGGCGTLATTYLQRICAAFIDPHHGNCRYQRMSPPPPLKPKHKPHPPPGTPPPPAWFYFYSPPPPSPPYSPHHSGQVLENVEGHT
ncbi:hypothetical protein ACFX2I_016235 [Malus domestica]